MLVHLPVVGDRLTRRRAGVGEGKPSPAMLGQVAAVAGEGGDLGGAHHGVVHAAVKRDEPRSLAAPYCSCTQ